MSDFSQNFKKPPECFRPLPFWSWNDGLDPELLRRQIGEMDEQGLGGYFMHARGGIRTEYLSEEWMRCVDECMKEGSARQLESWVYDENGWPSGFAGGLVTALGDEYHARGLAMEICEGGTAPGTDKNILGVYSYDSVANRVFRSGQAADKAIIIRHTSGPYYIDVLNKKAVRAFIDKTHEQYYKRFKDRFGKSMNGFFTDEPRLSEGDIPWSYILPEEFYRKYHYDILDILPMLFIKCEGYEKARYDFWALVSELFTTSFMKQINDWCETHGCKLTGHVMMEESIYSQMTGTAGVMPFYQYMGMPGMDWLRRTIGNPVVPKQVSSAAAQMGKKFVLTESFALSGWNVSFEELKWITEWQFVNGVNRLCQHLFAYTLQGLRKRDYPPSLFYQQPWWKEYHRFNSYVSRLSVLLTSGKGLVNVLMLHPMRSGWIAYDGEDNETLKKLDADFENLSQTLSGMHVDYHYGDETYIKQCGKVEGKVFRVGECSYKAVVLPSMLTCDPQTARLLCEFAKNGGTVVCYGDFPVTCGGLADGILEELKELSVLAEGNVDALMERLHAVGAVTLRIESGGEQLSEIRYQQRDCGKYQLFFMANQNKSAAYRATVRIAGTFEAARILIEDGCRMPVSVRHIDGCTELDLEFLPMQSHVIAAGDLSGLDLPVKTSREQEICAVRTGVDWKMTKTSLNALTLDYCDCTVDGTETWENVPVIRLMDRLLALRRSCDIALRFHFEIDSGLTRNTEFFLAAESAGEFDISVNGSGIAYRDIGWWKDTSFKKVDIRPYIKPGRNEIVLKRKFYESKKVYDVLFGKNVYETELNKLTYDTELESVYLVGDFGVYSKSDYRSGERGAVFTDGPFVISDLPTAVKGGDITPQGFCFFAGTVRLEQAIALEKRKGTRYVLDLGRPDAVVTKVFVNGTEASTLTWAPFTADITDFLKDGGNEIAVELFSGNRNLLGPHHHINGELYNVGPASFDGKWSWCDRPSEAVAADKNDMSKDYWQDSYCFVRFGI